MKTTKIQPSKFSRHFSLNRLLGVTYILVAIIILLTGVKFWLLSLRYDALFDATTYQSVTLTSGQTFFGHLERYGLKTYVLTDVYYLQRNQAVAPTDTATTDTIDATKTEDTTSVPTDQTSDKANADSGLSLQAIVDDLHQPNNYIVLNRDQIVFWQGLNSSSPILETIKKAKEDKK